jgi:hypothetical protein
METTRTTGQPQSREAGKTQQSKTLNNPLVIVDLDETQSSRQVNRLRKGEGKLMTRVERIVNDLIDAGTVKSTAQPVVIVVREYSSWFFGDNDDE